MKEQLSDQAENALAEAVSEPRLRQETGLAARIANIIEPSMRGLGYRLVRIKISAQTGMTIQIMAERPDGSMTIDDCEFVSQNISPLLEVDDPVPQAYRLEVSSPGVDRVLVRPSDFLRAIGHEARIELTNPAPEGRKRYRGIIKGLEESDAERALVLECADAPLEAGGRVRLRLTEIEDARLVLTESLIRASLRAGKQELAAQKEADDHGPRRGPGRFSAKSPKEFKKEKPLYPAGVQKGLKKSSSTLRSKTQLKQEPK